MHGVVYSFEDPQDGGESFLQVVTAITAFTVLQQLLQPGSGKLNESLQMDVEQEPVWHHIIFLFKSQRHNMTKRWSEIDKDKTNNMLGMRNQTNTRSRLEAHLKQKLVLGDSLNRFKEVGVQTKFMFQLLLAFLVHKNIINNRAAEVCCY